MPTLAKDLRNQLARLTIEARSAAEAACRSALENLAVHEKDYRSHMSIEQRQLRNRLRARGRALGDSLDERSGKQEIKRLAEDAAYEHWHRLLFTRFLAENHLLHTGGENGNVPVTLEDCDELAGDLGAKDGFDLACRFSEGILPGVFRTGDPVFELNLALNDQVKLRGLLDSLPKDVFTADDSLGWTYQFWQAQRKDEVNASGKKIGAEEISPVTQLFTEDYMVEFLLHNTLGAWWAGKLGPIVAASEEEARAKAALPARDGIGVTWTYLRFIQDEATKTWTPAAGTFEGWPKTAAEIKFLDPCMGSGHFPVFALPLLARLRMEEEKLSATEAIHAVLRDNIHGLELDPRCCQIGAFNLALTAWKLGGYRSLPPLHVACCGLAPAAQLKDWVALAGENQKLQRGMEKLHSLFKNAPVLGSLINPRAGEGDLLVAAFHELQPLLEKALAQETKDDTAHEMAVTARGLAKAAEILAGQFTLVATNVPYLGRGRQDDVLMDYCERVHPEAKGDLATCCIDRCVQFCAAGGSTVLVTPQNWLFLGTYKKFRDVLLRANEWNLLVRLGAGAFETISGEVVNVTLLGLTRQMPQAGGGFVGMDFASSPTPSQKATAIMGGEFKIVGQLAQLRNPDARITLDEASELPLFSTKIETGTGMQTFDRPRFIAAFWEVKFEEGIWEVLQSTPGRESLSSGMTEAVRWENGEGGLFALMDLKEKTEGYKSGIWRAGSQFWGKRGILHGVMSDLPCALYLGVAYDTNAAVLIPKHEEHYAAVLAFSVSGEFAREVRKLDQKMMVTNATFTKVPFDLAHWQKVAAEKYPHGLPKPFSSDPTQWLFNGHPAGADQPLHVAVARLLGYQWPRQTGSSFPDCPALGPDGLETLADEDGIVCLPPLNREQPAANRLRALLAVALGSFDEKSLLAATGSTKATLEEWLRDEFFEQHSKLFHHRPFLWHIWDGRKDGFSAIVNYHKLDHATLQKLTYTYLGNWIHTQESDAKADKPGAAERLGAAQALQAELVKILEGEDPYDIFARWKPLKAQAIGWHPDLNDGVRLNIRPFLTAKDLGKRGAGILRSKPNIKWDKDRGKEPQRAKADYPWFWCDSEPGADPVGDKTFAGNRWNNVHLTLAFKKGSQK
jgi:hypothetical protein